MVSHNKLFDEQEIYTIVIGVDKTGYTVKCSEYKGYEFTDQPVIIFNSLRHLTSHWNIIDPCYIPNQPATDVPVIPTTKSIQQAFSLLSGLSDLERFERVFSLAGVTLHKTFDVDGDVLITRLCSYNTDEQDYTSKCAGETILYFDSLTGALICMKGDCE